MFESVDAYLNSLYFNNLYKELSNDDKQKVVFEANETLLSRYPANRLTDRIIAMQVLYMLEGEGEEFAKLKRQGVTTYDVNNKITVTFGKTSNISPDIIILLDDSASVGSLI